VVHCALMVPLKTEFDCIQVITQLHPLESVGETFHVRDAEVPLTLTTVKLVGAGGSVVITWQVDHDVV
jgi:hypothetical protein